MKLYQKYLLLLALVIIGCTHNSKNSGPHYGEAANNGNIPVYTLAVHPLHNPRKLMQEYQPLINFLNTNIKDAQFTLEASRDYARFEEKYRKKKPDFILPNPWQTLQALDSGYSVIAMAGESCDFKGIFIVRKDANIHSPLDLKGKAVSYPSPTALAACIMPQYFLHCSGINVPVDIENLYVGSQESAIMNVYLGQTAVGATWPPPWRAFQKDRPQQAAMLKVIWETKPLINNSVMVRDDIPVVIKEQVKKHLTELNKTEHGKTILAGMETARFIPATNKDYDVVRDYIIRFEKEVRKIEKK